MAIELKQIEDKIIELIKDSWVLNGHPNTGDFERSLESIREQLGDDITLNIVGNSYGLTINDGVPAENIPYTSRKRGQGSGGQSKYITGLKNWAQTKLGISDEREALSVAFAIAENHKKYGLKGSGFLTKMVQDSQVEIDTMIEQYISNEINKNL